MGYSRGLNSLVSKEHDQQTPTSNRFQCLEDDDGDANLSLDNADG